jgi:DNA-binding transcriptional regulator GbsR (MarR family)
MDRLTEGRRQFIEDIGDLLNEHGLPRMAGRVVGALLICVPPYMALDELAAALQASKGAISMSTQLLLRLEIADRISLPGHRRHYVQIRPRLGESLFFDRDDQFERYVAVLRKGLEEMESEPIEAKRRLIGMLAFFDFIHGELPGLASRWAEQREELLQRRLAEYT